MMSNLYNRGLVQTFELNIIFFIFNYCSTIQASDHSFTTNATNSPKLVTLASHCRIANKLKVHHKAG